MSLAKTFSLSLLVGVVLVGCGGDKQPTLSDAVNKSFEISADMNKSTVNSILVVKPTSVVRIDNKEIWKYEGNIVDENKIDATYHNLTIKFVDGKVKNIGTFSCKLPPKQEK